MGFPEEDFDIFLEYYSCIATKQYIKIFSIVRQVGIK
jgi:hypothetical protein